ncbi:MAG: hypothetical protein ACYSUQ_12150, partial [Planctomycetota bacterium]
LRCSHCDYRLFGLSQRRCPECGRPFTWDEALAAARSRVNRLFERLWYHDPLRSLLRTWKLAALRPGKLWTQYSRFDRPKVGPLLVFMLLQWLVFAYGWPVMGRGADAAMNGLAGVLSERGWIAGPLRFFYFFRVSRDFLPFMAAWYLLTMACFVPFIRYHEHVGVGWWHSLRICVHATAFASFCTALWCLLEMLLDVTWFLGPAIGRGWVRQAYLSLGPVVFALGLTVTWAHLWIGYRKYLRAAHGWGVAAVCLFLGNRLAELLMLYV